MKTSKLLWIAALSIGAATTSCTQVQSELELSDIADSATISGQVMYNQGIMVDTDGTIYENYLVPVADQEVYVNVDLSNYKEGSAGFERYSATTDANGYYTITIPIGLNTINDYVDVAPFVGKYGEIVNGVVYNYDDAIYQEPTRTSFSLVSGENKTVNVKIINKPTFATEGLNRSIDVLGKIWVYEEVVVRDIYNTFENISVSNSELDREEVVVKVSHDTDSRSIYYTITVDDGEFDEELSFYDSWGFDEVTMTLMRSREVITEDQVDSDKFIHYYVMSGEADARKQYLSGSYNEIFQSQRLSNSYMEESECVFNDEYLLFTPENLNYVYGINPYNTSDYEYYNPMNW